MYKLGGGFPKPLGGVPSLKPQSATIYDKPNVFQNKQSFSDIVQPVSTPQHVQQPIQPSVQPTQPSVSDAKVLELEKTFKDIINEKLVKIDDFLINIKEKQDMIYNNMSQPQNTVNVSSEQVVKAAEPVKKKGGRGKKTYYNITDSMWNEIKQTYVELGEAFKSKTYSDGESYYVEHKNKKILLDGKGYLKLINDKK